MILTDISKPKEDSIDLYSEKYRIRDIIDLSVPSRYINFHKLKIVEEEYGENTYVSRNRFGEPIIYQVAETMIFMKVLSKKEVRDLFIHRQDFISICPKYHTFEEEREKTLFDYSVRRYEDEEYTIDKLSKDSII